VALIVATAAMGAACGSPRTSGNGSPATNTGALTGVPRGGNLVVSVRNEPRSFSRLAARETTTDLLSNLTQAKLVRGRVEWHPTAGLSPHQIELIRRSLHHLNSQLEAGELEIKVGSDGALRVLSKGEE